MATQCWRVDDQDTSIPYRNTEVGIRDKCCTFSVSASADDVVSIGLEFTQKSAEYRRSGELIDHLGTHVYCPPGIVSLVNG